MQVATLGTSGLVVETEDGYMWLLGDVEHRETPDCYEGDSTNTQKNGMTVFSGLGRALPQLRMTVDHLGPGDCHSAAVEWTKQAVLNTAFLRFIMLLLMPYAYVLCPRTTLLSDDGG